MKRFILFLLSFLLAGCAARCSPWPTCPGIGRIERLQNKQKRSHSSLRPHKKTQTANLAFSAGLITVFPCVTRSSTAKKRLDPTKKSFIFG